MDYLRVSMDQVRSHFKIYDAWDEDAVVLWKGFFQESMPRLRESFIQTNRRIAVLRADGDMYESTVDSRLILAWCPASQIM